MSTFGKELLESAREAAAIAAGKTRPARAFVPEAIDVKAIRSRTKLSQSQFADRFGVPVGTVRDWEQGRRRPDQTARVLLKVIEEFPEAVAKAAASTRTRPGATGHATSRTSPGAVVSRQARR